MCLVVVSIGVLFFNPTEWVCWIVVLRGDFVHVLESLQGVRGYVSVQIDHDPT